MQKTGITEVLSSLSLNKMSWVKTGSKLSDKMISLYYLPNLSMCMKKMWTMGPSIPNILICQRIMAKGLSPIARY